uniref:Uncharacterized protein n=1 Tax=Meloidogyne incognita TaxID=6306 RepID=A0A914NH10_MELIC
MLNEIESNLKILVHYLHKHEPISINMAISFKLFQKFSGQFFMKTTWHITKNIFDS